MVPTTCSSNNNKNVIVVAADVKSATNSELADMQTETIQAFRTYRTVGALRLVQVTNCANDSGLDVNGRKISRAQESGHLHVDGKSVAKVWVSV